MVYYRRSAWTSTTNQAVSVKRKQVHATLHYPGFGSKSIRTAGWSRERCFQQLRAWRNMHVGSGAYREVAYNLYALPTGDVAEGRGNRQNGANGNSTSNRAGMSVQVLIGDDEPLTEGHLKGIFAALALLESWHPGITSRQYGHSHWVSTSCPGPHVRAGIPFRAGAVPSAGAGTSTPKPVVKADPSRQWRTSPRVAAMSTADVKAIQSELVGAGYSVGSYGVDGSYGDGTGTAVQQLQTDLGLTADGVWGPATQEALMTLKTDIDYIKARLDTKLSHAEKRILDGIPNRVWGIGGGKDAPMISRRFEKGKEYPETTLGSLTDRIVRQQLVPLRGEVAGLSKAIEQLAAGRNVDPEEIKAAVAAGVDEALGSLEVTVSKGD